MEWLKDVLRTNRYAIERMGPFDDRFVPVGGNATLCKSHADEIVKALSNRNTKFRMVRT